MKNYTLTFTSLDKYPRICRNAMNLLGGVAMALEATTDKRLIVTWADNNNIYFQTDSEQIVSLIKSRFEQYGGEVKEFIFNEMD